MSRQSRIAPEWRWKGADTRLPRICAAPRGCTLPALPGRFICARHADELERRGAKNKADADVKAPDHVPEVIEGEE